MEEEANIKKWLTNSLSKEELSEFEQTEDYRFVKRLSNALQHFKSPHFDTSEELSKLNTKKNIQLVDSVSSWQIWLKAAAVIALIAGLTVYLIPNSNKTEIYEAENKIFVSLPDSSIVKLNNQSRLSFDPNHWNGVRQAHLVGEGYFVVKPGETFDIITRSGKVSVLGTSFNIVDRDGFFEVQCYRGQVKVSTTKETVVLSANQSYRIIDHKGEIVHTKLDRTPAWIKGESDFNNVPYRFVLEELERQYNVTISEGPINTKLRFSGKFTHSDLYLALKSITIPMNIGFEVDDSQVKLVSDKNQM